MFLLVLCENLFQFRLHEDAVAPDDGCTDELLHHQVQPPLHDSLVIC